MYFTLIVYGDVCVLHLILDSLLAVVIESLSHFFGWILMYDAKMIQIVNVLPHDRSILYNRFRLSEVWRRG